MQLARTTAGEATQSGRRSMRAPTTRSHTDSTSVAATGTGPPAQTGIARQLPHQKHSVDPFAPALRTEESERSYPGTTKHPFRLTREIQGKTLRRLDSPVRFRAKPCASHPPLPRHHTRVSVRLCETTQILAA